jgi:hypothetical protein
MKTMVLDQLAKRREREARGERAEAEQAAL